MPATRSPRVRSKLDEAGVARKRTLTEAMQTFLLQKSLGSALQPDYHETDIRAVGDQASLVGQIIKILWPLDDEWYSAKVIDYNLNTGKHKLHYEDGDREWLELYQERIKIPVTAMKSEGVKPTVIEPPNKRRKGTPQDVEKPDLELDMDAITNQKLTRKSARGAQTPTKLLMVLAEQAAAGGPKSPQPVMVHGTGKRSKKQPAVLKAEDIKVHAEETLKETVELAADVEAAEEAAEGGTLVVASGPGRPPKRAAALKVAAEAEEEGEDWAPSPKSQQLVVRGRRGKRTQGLNADEYQPGEEDISGNDSDGKIVKLEDFELLNEDDQLKIIAAKDPRKAKRMLANRRSAERSRLRRLELITKLEAEVAALKKERDSYSKRVHKLEENWISEREEKLELRRQLQELQKTVAAAS